MQHSVKYPKWFLHYSRLTEHEHAIWLYQPDKLAVAEHNTEVGNKNNTGILLRKSKHMDQLVTVVRDQAARQQHKLGGQIGNLSTIFWKKNGSHNSPRMEQSCSPQSTPPFLNTDTHGIKIYHSQQSTSHSKHYLHISHRLGPLKGPFLELSTPCGMVKAPSPFPPSTAVTDQNSSNLPRNHKHFFLPVTSYTWTRQSPEERTQNMVLQNVSTMSEDD